MIRPLSHFWHAQTLQIARPRSWLGESTASYQKASYHTRALFIHRSARIEFHLEPQLLQSSTLWQILWHLDSHKFRIGVRQ